MKLPSRATRSLSGTILAVTAIVWFIGPIAARDANTAPDHNRRCIELIKKHEYDRAISECDASIRLDPKYHYAYLNRCWAWAEKREYGRAVADCSGAIRLDQTSATAYSLRCEARTGAGEYDAAIADCNEALRLDSKFINAYINRCWANNDKGDYDRALVDCNEAVRLDPRRASAHNLRCAVWRGKRDYDRAIADCNSALQLDPKYLYAYNNRGNAWLAKGDDDRAIADYTEAIRLDPKYVYPYSNRCEAWNNKRDPDRAIADCNEAIRLDAKSVSSFNLRCFAWNLKKHFDQAISDCTEALRLDAKYGHSYYNRGTAWRSKGDLDRAITDYSEVIRLFPRHFEALLNRGLLYETQGQLGKALADFRALIGIDSNQANASERVHRVEQKIVALAKSEADGLQTSETRIALVVGNSRYEKISPLSNSGRDAEAVAATLKRIGFSNVTLKLDLPREKFIEALKDFASRADRADWAVIYYAGHGIELRGVNYLVPTDAHFASNRDIPFEGVALEQVLLAVEGARKLRLVILDACRGNPYIRMMTGSNLTRSVGRGFAPIEPDGATLVVYAAKAGQVALDGERNGNSPFTRSLTKHLDTPRLEINLLFRRVRDDVLSATSRQQEPFMYGSLPAEAFYFR